MREQWLTLVRELYAINPAVLRSVVHRLEILEQTTQVPGARETRLALETNVLTKE